MKHAILGPSPPPHKVIIDTGCTGHYLSTQAPVTNKRPNPNPLDVTLANQDHMYSTHTCELPINHLPKKAKQAHIFPALGDTSLLSMGTLLDAGCTAKLTSTTCDILHNDQVVLTGNTQCPNTTTLDYHPSRTAPSANIATTPPTEDVFAYLATFQDGCLPLSIDDCTPELQALGAAINNRSTPADLVAFAHAALFSPALSTLDKALAKGILPAFPGLTRETLKKYPPFSEATTMGHLDNRRKNIQSTKPKVPKEDQDGWTLVGPKKTKATANTAATDPEDDAFPDQLPDMTRTHNCFLATAETKNIVYTDQTGRLPLASSSGNNYLLIAYDYDSNCILLRPIKNRTAEALTSAITNIHNTLAKGGCKPQFHRLDNECPQLLKDYFKQQQVQHQLVPPHDHRSNAAERAIRTAKNHLAAGWHSCDDKFPMHLWDKTIPQAELTLNLLRSSRLNPKLSSWVQINGLYDFNRTPIAPPGIKVLAHIKPEVRLHL